MATEHEEGWYTDPYARHEARWFSDGAPTKLVRDGEVESYDAPPDEEPSQKAERIEPEVAATGGSDLIRAGDPQSGGDIASLEEDMGSAAFEGGAHPQIVGH
jgi:hypothetical protein